jgi:predicted SnoaL-like aldol condensation-catalyzing enzyme
MSQALKAVEEIYEAMEQGNIGKIISVLDESFAVHLAKSLGGVYQGREGILDVVSKMCGSESKIKKVTESFIDDGNRIIVLGSIELIENDMISDAIPFTDVWKIEQNKLVEVQLFYLDVEKLYTYLN